MTRAAAPVRWREAELSAEPGTQRSQARGGFERLLLPVHRWVWSNAARRVAKLARFAETEASGGRDIARAAEVTRDRVLRRLYLRHAMDEQRHARLFRERASEIARSLSQDPQGAFQADWVSPGERGFEDVPACQQSDSAFLAFLHLSEKAAKRRFSVYREVLLVDPRTRDIFTEVLRDEAFHMNYTHSQLNRIAPKRRGARLWGARLARLWKGYLRLAGAIGNLIGGVVLTAQYFLLLPLFAWIAKSAEKKAPAGWVEGERRPNSSLRSQY